MLPNHSAPERAKSDGDARNRANYHVLAELGRGGAGVVSLALSRGIGGFNKLVVLKTIKEELRTREGYVKMFLDEATLAARMNHPNVVQTYEVYEHAGLPVIVMEYLDGQSFSSVRQRALQDPRLTEATTITILSKTLGALEYAHGLRDFRGNALKLVHRDVTPHNIVITYQGQVKLLDFGIAKLTTSRDQTATGMIKGKLDYMPPEQLQGELDHRSDLFAVGVMLWEGVARRRLWEGLGDAEVMRHLLDGDIPALRRAKPDVDPELEHIVSRAIAADPEARYTSAAEFQAALERYLATRDGPVSEAALGGLIGELGADARRQTQELVASKLEELAAGPSPTGREAQRALPNLRSDAPQQEEPTASASTVALTAPARDGHRRATGILAGLGLAAFATMIWNARSPRAVEPERAPVSAPATKVERVRIEVTVDPPEAKIFFDGLPVESNPFVALVPKDALTHNVRALAPGFNPRTEALTLVSDVRLHLALDRQVPPALSSPKPSPLSARASARVKAPANACDPPYFLDESGIKRYRRECLSDGPASQR